GAVRGEVVLAGAARERGGARGGQGGGQEGAAAHQPFTAPDIMPLTSRRCSREKNNRLGSVASRAAAAMGPRSTAPSAPRKWVRITDIVCFSGDLSRTRAKKNSFHAVTKENIRVATS